MSSLYSPKAILTKQPVAIASAIRAILLVFVLAGVVALDEKLLAGIALAIEIGLSLFTWSSVVPVAKVKEEQMTVVEEVAAPPEAPLPPPVGGDDAP